MRRTKRDHGTTDAPAEVAGPVQYGPSHEQTAAMPMIGSSSCRTARASPRSRARSNPTPNSRPVNDSWVAACCLARELPLATLNVKDYVGFAEHEGLELIQ